MKLPEWRPIPPHIKNDDSDTRGAFAIFGLLGAVALVLLGVLMLIAGLLA
jgi:hypothetical protein